MLLRSEHRSLEIDEKSKDEPRDMQSLVDKEDRHSSIASYNKKQYYNHPPGFGRTAKIPRFVEAAGLSERLKSFVIIELVNGHQIIDHWNCSDLLQHVNSIADSYSPYVPNTPTIYFNFNYANELNDKKNKKRCNRCFDDTQQYLQVSKLTYRDLRQVFTDGSPVPSIETRRNCILLCLPPLSCIIMVDRVFILVVEELEMDHLIYTIQNIQLHHMGRSNTFSCQKTESSTLIFKPYKNNLIPLEFKCLEALLSASFEHLDADINHLERQFDTMMPDPNDSLPTSKREKELHSLKTSMRIYQDRVSLFDRVFNSILSNPDQIMRMELTKLCDQEKCYIEALEHMKVSKEPYECTNEKCQHFNDGNCNPDLEILLEFFDQELEMFRQRVQRLHEQIESVERLSLFQLALTRNRILRWDVGSGMISVIISCGTLVSGLFGMNLRSKLEESVFSFYLVSGVILFLTILLSLTISFIIKTVKL